MSSKKYSDLEQMVASAQSVPEEMMRLEPDPVPDRFKRALSAVHLQPNMPREVAAVLDLTPQKGLEDSEYEVVPVDEIVENPFNARHRYDQEAIDKLALSIAADGQLQPGIATIRDGKKVLLGGHYRLKAIKKANKLTMNLVIRKDISDQDMYRLSFKENDERHPQTAIDNAYAWKNLLDRNVYKSDTELGESIGVSKSTISKTLTILKLSSDVIDFASENPDSLGISLLYELQQLEEIAGSEQTLKMATEIVEGNAKRADITKLRERLKSSKQRKPHDTSRQYKLNQGGTMKEWNSGRVVLDVKIANPEDRQKFLDEVKKRFGPA